MNCMMHVTSCHYLQPEQLAFYSSLQMRTVTLPFWFATAMTPPTLACEGTLLVSGFRKLILVRFMVLVGFRLRGFHDLIFLLCLQAGRDLKYLSFSMVSCFLGGGALLLVIALQGCHTAFEFRFNHLQLLLFECGVAIQQSWLWTPRELVDISMLSNCEKLSLCHPFC